MELGRGSATCMTMSGLSILTFLFVCLPPASGQAPASPKSPKEVLQAYRKMDAEGERLTASGWYATARFFVKPGRRPQHYVLAVIESERVTDPDPWFKGGSNRVQLGVACSEVGQIDASGRFTTLVAPSLIGPSGRSLGLPGTPQIHGPAAIVRIYDLVLTNTRWEFGLRREGLREVKGPPEWRIVTFELEPVVTVKAAVRYLEQLRDESSSEIIKKNADKSIAILRRLQ